MNTSFISFMLKSFKLFDDCGYSRGQRRQEDVCNDCHKKTDNNSQICMAYVEHAEAILTNTRCNGEVDDNDMFIPLCEWCYSIASRSPAFELSWTLDECYHMDPATIYMKLTTAMAAYMEAVEMWRLPLHCGNISLWRCGFQIVLERLANEEIKRKSRSNNIVNNQM